MGVKRDPDAWWKSMGNLNKVAAPWWLPYFLAPMPTWRWFPAFIEGIRGRGKLGAKVSGNGAPGPRKLLPRKAFLGLMIPYVLTIRGSDLVALHNKSVEKVTPPGQLYWMEITEGWAPLCKMLNVPIPQEPFPRVNDAAALNELIRGMMMATAGVWLVILILLATAIYLGSKTGFLIPSNAKAFVTLSAK